MKYDYREAIKADIENYLAEEGVDLYTVDRDALYDDLWQADSVTGNASGSYTCNRWRAEENLCHNLDLLYEAGREYGCRVTMLEEGAESCDVLIRCYLLDEVLDEIFKERRRG